MFYHYLPVVVVVVVVLISFPMNSKTILSYLFSKITLPDFNHNAIIMARQTPANINPMMNPAQQALELRQ